MRTLLAFAKKEVMEQFRSPKLIIFLAVFVALGLMNPLITVFTPKLFEMLAETYPNVNATMADYPVNAWASWTQFFKNIPVGLLVFIILESGIFTGEYGRGTLVLTLTKGLSRDKVVISKTAVLVVLWSVLYWLCFAVTFVVSRLFWDNSTVQNLMFSVTIWYVLGLLAVELVVLFSVIAKSNIMVLLGTGGAFFAMYLVGLLPKIGEFSPTMLMTSAPLLVGTSSASDYAFALAVTAVLCVGLFASSIPLFNKKQL